MLICVTVTRKNAAEELVKYLCLPRNWDKLLRLKIEMFVLAAILTEVVTGKYSLQNWGYSHERGVVAGIWML